MPPDNKSSPARTAPNLWRDRYVVIAGPTASGKSALALALAQRADGVIINADSMQLYDDLRQITARPTAGDEAAAPHRLYGVIDGGERASVATWMELGAEAMAEARSLGKLPIIVGGTGMYINAGLHGLAPIPVVPPEIHASAMAKLGEIGGAAFRQALAKRDPVIAARLADGDSQRLIRAMGVVEATGRPLSDWQNEPHRGQFSGAPLCICVMPERGALYGRIDARFDRMLEAGAIDEVKRLYARHLDPGLPVMKALGVRELLAYMGGQMTLQRAAELAKRDSRHYAKRQMTWLRNNYNANLTINEQLSESLIETIFANLINSVDQTG